jgi:ATP-dependent helicase Lhr and Lhr-like helicase
MSDVLPRLFERWFAARGWRARPHQIAVAAEVAAGRSVLLIAPTGGGKTLAGFLPSLIDLAGSQLPPTPGPSPRGGGEQQGAAIFSLPPCGGGPGWGGRKREHRGLHTLYISPLKALAVDIARNLEAPVAEMGLDVSVETRTGDTPQSKRRGRNMPRPTSSSPRPSRSRCSSPTATPRACSRP